MSGMVTNYQIQIISAPSVAGCLHCPSLSARHLKEVSKDLGTRFCNMCGLVGHPGVALLNPVPSSYKNIWPFWLVAFYSIYDDNDDDETGTKK